MKTIDDRKKQKQKRKNKGAQNCGKKRGLNDYAVL